MERTSISGDERVFRHIPGGTTFQAPGPRITSKNFALRPERGERGVSISRECFTTANELIAKIGDLKSGSRIAVVTVDEIRELGLDVITDPLPNDLGHALIISGAETLDSQTTRRRLAELFQFIDPPS